MYTANKLETSRPAHMQGHRPSRVPFIKATAYEETEGLWTGHHHLAYNLAYNLVYRKNMLFLILISKLEFYNYWPLTGCKEKEQK